MVTSSLNITLNGSNTLRTPSKSCPQKQCDNIEKLAIFIADNSAFLDITSEVFLRCSHAPFDEQLCDQILKNRKDEVTPKKLLIYTELLKKFYKESLEIDNDRGRVLETLCAYAIQDKYKTINNSEIKFHCGISLEYDGTKFTIQPRDVDVGAKTDIHAGDYIESKTKLSPDYPHDNDKMLVLVELANHFNEIDKRYKLPNNFHVFVLTSRNDKLAFYENTWVPINFIGVEKFVNMFL